jgi:hypothetical protein
VTAPKVTRSMMKEAEKNLSRHIISLNDRFFHIEEQYMKSNATKKGKELAKELLGIKLHVKELKQIVLDFEELG